MAQYYDLNGQLREGLGEKEAAERRKWESGYGPWGMGAKPYKYEEYPKIMYKARKNPAGQTTVIETRDHLFGQGGAALGAADNWSRGNYTKVNDADEERRHFGLGWRTTQAEAIQLFEAEEDAVSTAAAERHFAVRTMSEKAQREVAAAEEAADGKHLGEVARTPIPKRTKVKLTPEERSAVAKANWAKRKAKAEGAPA